MAKITATGVSALQSLMNDTTSDPVKNAAGVVFVAVNKLGEGIFEHASGTTGLGVDAPMTTEHSFWIASCTKMITGIACMQLVEQGHLTLDDVELVERICPVSCMVLFWSSWE
jgi:CubicO group peptidase (beta-lactamase class C family)